jgi:diguanylate cyclase (GGDEF)-like protein
MANTDPVTNLINRRMMMNRIEDEKVKVDRGGKPFTVVMVDIDNFKSINDAYGHDGGDFVLVQLAERIKLSLRKTDLVSRWGGDEFLFLLPETRLNEGAKVAEKVRDRIIKTPFVYRERDIQVTLTFGVSQCSMDVGVGSVIRKADQALYLGKEMGKNRVVTENMTQG